MFVNVCLGTTDLPRAITFYEATLSCLGLRRCDRTPDTRWEGWAGWGFYNPLTKAETALWVGHPFNGQAATPGNGSMVTLRAEDWQQVRDFHQAALDNGGSSEGQPELRVHYDPDFYAAYVRDPDGNKLAVVCRGFTHEPSAASVV